MRDFHNLWCSIDMRGRECSSATLETGIGARISPAMSPKWLCTHRQETSTKDPIPYIHAFGDVAAHALAISSSASSGSSSQRAYPSTISSSRGPGRGALLLRPPSSSPHRRRKPHPEHELPTLGMYCNPYCNRAGTHWYTMDKAMLPDHQKPHK